MSLYNINWLVFITETQRVYCAVRTGSKNKIRVNVVSKHVVAVVLCHPISNERP
jgi:hypothetical protein